MAGSPETYYLEIEIDKIPRDAISIFERKDGSEGARVKLQVSSLRQIDKMGNTHTVYMYRSKAERESGVPVTYIGKGKKLYGD